MQEPSLLNRSLQKLRNLVTELRRSNDTLKSEQRLTRGTLLALRNMNERLLQKEQEMRLMVHKLRSLFNSSHQGYILLNRSRCVVSFNAMAAEITRLMCAEPLVESRNIFDYTAPESHAALRHVLQKAFNGESTVYEQRIPGNMGVRWLRCHYDAFREDNGAVEYVLVSYIDLTEEVTLRLALEEKERHAQLAQKQLTANEANLKAVINNTDAFIYSLDRNYRYVMFNEPLAEQVRILFGVELNLGVCALDLLSDAKERQRYKSRYDEALAGGRIQFLESRDYFGSTVYLEYTLTPIESEHGIIGLSCFVYDITNRRETARKKAELQRRLKAIFEGTTDAILLTDNSGHYIQCNPAAARMLGYTQNELCQLAVSDLVINTDSDAPLDSTGSWDGFIAEGSQTGVVTLRRKDGNTVRCHYNATTNVLPGVHLSILTDITARCNAEQNYREIFNKASDAIFVHDIETGAVVDANHTATQMTGFTRDELISGHHLVNADTAGYTMEDAQLLMQKTLNDGPQTFEWQGKDKDGNIHWAEVNLTKANIAGTDRLLAFSRTDVTRCSLRTNAIGISES